VKVQLFLQDFSGALPSAYTTPTIGEAWFRLSASQHLTGEYKARSRIIEKRAIFFNIPDLINIFVFSFFITFSNSTRWYPNKA
jgi:hypothetical protein